MINYIRIEDKAMSINEYDKEVKVYTLDGKLLKDATLMKYDKKNVILAFDKTSRNEIKQLLENDDVQNEVILLMTHNLRGMCYFYAESTNIYDGNAPRRINVVFSSLQKFETIQRRQDVKVKTHNMQIKLSLLFRNMKEITAELIDISAGGILFEYPSEMLMENEVVIYHFQSPKANFDVKARILRVQQLKVETKYGDEKEIRCYGCHFEDIMPKEECSIREFVLYLQAKEILREKERNARLLRYNE